MGRGTRRLRRGLPWVVAGTGLALVGLVVFLTYGGTVTWTVAQLVGAGVLVVGLLLLSAVGGWVAGRRSRPAG